MMAERKVENIVRTRWCEILEIDQADQDDHFFQSGGNSLLAVRLTAALREDLGVRIPVATLFEMDTLVGYSKGVTALVSATALPADAEL